MEHDVRDSSFRSGLKPGQSRSPSPRETDHRSTRTTTKHKKSPERNYSTVLNLRSIQELINLIETFSREETLSRCTSQYYQIFPCYHTSIGFLSRNLNRERSL